MKASFFITGHYLNTASDIVKRMIEEGHIVGNHTPLILVVDAAQNEIVRKKSDQKDKQQDERQRGSGILRPPLLQGQCDAG